MDWQPIHSAPTGRKVLVWWPLVALIELDGVAGQVVGGEMMISARARGGWETPDVMNTVITTLDGRYDSLKTLRIGKNCLATRLGRCIRRARSSNCGIGLAPLASVSLGSHPSCGALKVTMADEPTRRTPIEPIEAVSRLVRTDRAMLQETGREACPDEWPNALAVPLRRYASC
jgi:hypothetical protein